jgi:serine/threonine protein kinase
VKKYNGDGTIIIEIVRNVAVLTSEDCTKLKGDIDFAIQRSVNKREEEDKKKKAEQDRLAAAEKAEQDRLAAEKATKEAAIEAVAKANREKLQQRLGALPKLTVEPSIGEWFKLNQDKETKFYASSPSLQPNVVKIMGIMKDFSKNEHIIQYETVEADEDGVYSIGGKEFTISAVGRNLIPGDSIIVTKNYGSALKDGDGRVTNAVKNIIEIKNQAVEGLEALHKAGIVHQDIKLDNMVWDGKTLTLIDLGNAKEVVRACEAQFNGDKMNILPPPGVGDAMVGDYWSLVLALLNLGGKNLQAVEDVVKGGGSSSITEALFTAGGRKDGKC